MWPRAFQDRLQSWHNLRNEVESLPKDHCLERINHWWFEAPWHSYYLHWDDMDTWPDPWQLLEDNMFCSLARGLGIVYTVCMLDREDIQDCCLIETKTDNLVLVESGKYVLNWDCNTIVNINPEGANPRRCIKQQQLHSRIR